MISNTGGWVVGSEGREHAQQQHKDSVDKKLMKGGARSYLYCVCERGGIMIVHTV